MISDFAKWLWRALRGLAALWRAGARWFADVLPKGLYARSLLIVIVPMVLLQTAVAYVFMQRHFDIVTHRLSAAVARDVGAMVGPLSRHAARGRRPEIARDRRRPLSDDGRIDAAAGLAAARAENLFRRARSADSRPAGGNRQSVARSLLGRSGRTLGPDGDPRRSRLRGAEAHHPAFARLRAQRADFHPVDGRRLDGADFGGDPVPAQPDPADPSAGRSGGRFRQGTRRRIPAARRARSASGRLRVHRNEAAHRAGERTAHRHAEWRQPRPAHDPDPLPALGRNDGRGSRGRAAAGRHRGNARHAGGLSRLCEGRWRRADDGHQSARRSRGVARGLASATARPSMSR